MVETRIAERSWRHYLNPLMGVELYIEDDLLNAFGPKLARLGHSHPMDVMQAVASQLKHAVPKLRAFHECGHPAGQVEWLLPGFGLAIHFFSYGGNYYASATPLLPYE